MSNRRSIITTGLQLFRISMLLTEPALSTVAVKPKIMAFKTPSNNGKCYYWYCILRWFTWQLYLASHRVGWLCWGLTSQSTIFQSCRDGAIASWVINQYFWGVKCLAQGHNTECPANTWKDFMKLYEYASCMSLLWIYLSFVGFAVCRLINSCGAWHFKRRLWYTSFTKGG